MTRYDLERYLHVRHARGGSFAPDGTLSFLLDATGVPQVWSLDAPRSWPAQRTFGDERVTFAQWSPTRQELIFGMDRGGNERAQLFRLDRDGTVTDLTAHPDAKHRWGGWAHGGDKFAFTSNRRDEASFDVYTQARTATGSAARREHESDGWLSVAGWSPSDDRLLVHEARSNFDHDVHVLDLATGSLAAITDDAEKVRYQSLQWGPSGAAVYLVTDRGTDTLRLARLSIETGALETVVEGEGWNVDGVTIDDETGRVVYSRNVDGYTELTVGELDGPTSINRFPGPELPPGVAGGVDFDDDAERFAITATGRRMNPAVYVVAVESGTTTRWTDASTAGIPRETFVEPELTRYETHDGRSIPALLSLPETVPDTGAPVIVDVHGGPESQRRPSFGGLTAYFLSREYAIFEPNVRGSTGYGRGFTHLDDGRRRMDAVADVVAGLDWLGTHDAVDTDRAAILGGSYGGFVVLAAMAEYPDRWAAGVDVVGIANFVTFLENTGAWRRELREAEYGSLADDREFLASISPVNRADRIEAPLFVIHGANDPRVPVDEAEQIAAAVADNDIPVETRIFEDEGHGLSKLENRIAAYTAVVDFLDEHV